MYTYYHEQDIGINNPSLRNCAVIHLPADAVESSNCKLLDSSAIKAIHVCCVVDNSAFVQMWLVNVKYTSDKMIDCWVSKKDLVIRLKLAPSTDGYVPTLLLSNSLATSAPSRSSKKSTAPLRFWYVTCNEVFIFKFSSSTRT